MFRTATHMLELQTFKSDIIRFYKSYEQNLYKELKTVT